MLQRKQNKQALSPGRIHQKDPNGSRPVLPILHLSSSPSAVSRLATWLSLCHTTTAVLFTQCASTLQSQQNWVRRAATRELARNAEMPCFLISLPGNSATYPSLRTTSPAEQADPWEQKVSCPLPPLCLTPICYGSFPG
jgi:hypothetical protein